MTEEVSWLSKWIFMLLPVMQVDMAKISTQSTCTLLTILMTLVNMLNNIDDEEEAPGDRKPELFGFESKATRRLPTAREGGLSSSGKM